MRTGNSGEHCMSMKLAELLTYSSSFSVETYEMVNLLEEFGGIVPTENQEAMDKGIEVMQVETRNPHFHEEKGDIHLKEMIDGSLGCIYHSKICHPKLREKIVEELRGKGVIEESQEPSALQKINPFKDIDMLQFGKILHNKATSFVHS
jgi:mannosyl-3-phosphoglycerate synthase